MNNLGAKIGTVCFIGALVAGIASAFIFSPSSGDDWQACDTDLTCKSGKCVVDKGHSTCLSKEAKFYFQPKSSPIPRMVPLVVEDVVVVAGSNRGVNGGGGSIYYGDPVGPTGLVDGGVDLPLITYTSK